MTAPRDDPPAAPVAARRDDPSSALPATRPQRRLLLLEEVVVVLSLSLLASAVFALISLFEAPVRPSVQVRLFAPVSLARQLAEIVFDLAPVALVLHLARRDGGGPAEFGLSTARLARDVWWGALLGLGSAGVGLVLYLASLTLAVNRFVVPIPPTGHWWTVPVLLLGSARSALLEEVVVVGYLVRRLEQVGLDGAPAVLASAALRGAYHLFQGWGSFTGNLLLGLVAGGIFLRWRRTWPLVVAHFLVDALAGLGYLAFRGDCVFGLCIP